MGWWAEATFGKGSNANIGGMPPELFQLLAEQGAAEEADFPQETLDRIGHQNRLPDEIMELIRHHRVVPDGAMTPAEALRHRLKLMEERSQFDKTTEDRWKWNGYNFCEH
jgi:hypothetical protein